MIAIYGIDYGSNLAGTTALAFLKNEQIQIIQSKIKQSADKFLLDTLSGMPNGIIGIDAPLSLPNGVLGKEGSFFYRKADIELKAMSPMFLGGLTARAMQLYAQLTNFGFTVFETYPKVMALNLALTEHLYKVEKAPSVHFMQNFKNTFPFEFNYEPTNWHQVDASLAWLAAYRRLNNIGKAYGDILEGQIYV